MARKITYTQTSARGSKGSRADLLSRAGQLFDKGDLTGANTLYAQLLATDPDNTRALIGMAVTTTRRSGDTAAALALLDRAASNAPDDSHIPQTRAALLNEAGDFEGAVAAARQALAINPGCALAYVNLTDSTKITPGDPLFDLALNTLRTADLPPSDQLLIHFALGKAYQDCGDHDRAFRHIDTGNALKPDPDPFAQTQAVADRLKSLFTPAYCATLNGASKTTPCPIFIIGMPRSGTTLLDRMLAAHPQVSSAGERREMNQLGTAFFAKAQAALPNLPAETAIRRAMTGEALADLARAYITPVAKAAPTPRPLVIDKMPLNFWNVGLIAATFANAPILHLRRHPLDTGLSNYAANFRTGLTFSNRLAALGQYFRLYDDLMSHWEKVFPGRITPINYETLVSHPEREIRRILTACGLDWNDSCLHPDQTEGMITTASRWQARQKITTASVDKWRRYETHLAPLIDALGGMDWIEDYEARRRA